jgi:hypothetical protein
MFGIGGFNPVSLLATAALGPMGGIVAQLASQLMSQIGQQLIQNMGNQLGLPQSAIDMAQGSFAASYGDVQGQSSNLRESISNLARETGASPAQEGEAQRAMDDLLRDAVLNSTGSEEAREAKSGGRAGGWLRAMAEALGKKLDASAHEMQDLAGKIDKKDPSTTTDFQVASQEFNMLMNAANTAIKSIGEAMANTARKQ